MNSVSTSVSYIWRKYLGIFKNYCYLELFGTFLINILYYTLYAVDANDTDSGIAESDLLEKKQ